MSEPLTAAEEIPSLKRGGAVVIHQPNYLPGLTYFSKIAEADVFVLLDSVGYSKNNWTNRNRIKTAQGAKWLTVPVVTAGRLGQPILETETLDSGWEHKHWQTLISNYSAAPFFDRYEERLEAVYSQRQALLAPLNEELIRLLAGWLGLDTPMVRSSELSVDGHGTELLVSICRAIGASEYVSGPGGRKYMDDSLFRDAGVELRFHEFVERPYTQLFGDFAEGLSALDAVMNLGDQARELL